MLQYTGEAQHRHVARRHDQDAVPYPGVEHRLGRRWPGQPATEPSTSRKTLPRQGQVAVRSSQRRQRPRPSASTRSCQLARVIAAGLRQPNPNSARIPAEILALNSVASTCNWYSGRPAHAVYSVKR
jgi:hypothetical protein